MKIFLLLSFQDILYIVLRNRESLRSRYCIFLFLLMLHFSSLRNIWLWNGKQIWSNREEFYNTHPQMMFPIFKFKIFRKVMRPTPKIFYLINVRISHPFYSAYSIDRCVIHQCCFLVSLYCYFHSFNSLYSKYWRTLDYHILNL